MIVASPGTIMVAMTSANRMPWPGNSRNEKAKAASEQETICPKVIVPATRNEFTMKRRSGTVVSASEKFRSVGYFGTRLSSVVKSSLDGISAILIAYSSGRRTMMANATLAPSLSAVRIRRRASARAFISFFRASSSLADILPSIGITILSI